MNHKAAVAIYELSLMVGAEDSYCLARMAMLDALNAPGSPLENDKHLERYGNAILFWEYNDAAWTLCFAFEADRDTNKTTARSHLRLMTAMTSLYEAIQDAIEEIGDENKPGFDALMESDNYSAVLQSAYDAVFNAVSEAVQDALVETANEVDSDYSIDDCTPDNLISWLGEALHDAVLSGAGYGR